LRKRFFFLEMFQRVSLKYNFMAPPGCRRWRIVVLPGPVTVSKLASPDNDSYSCP
jgi:hypothetical protein